MRRILSLALVGCVLFGGVCLWAALPATDDFAGTGALSASWTNLTAATAPARASGVAQGGAAAAYSGAYWSADSFDADHCATTTYVSAVIGSYYVGPAVRAQQAGAGWDAYLFITDGTTGAGHSSIQEITDGSSAELKALTNTFTGGDLLKVCAVGTTITVYKNGSSFDSTTDATLSAGAAGMVFYGDSGQVDDFVGANNAAAATAKRFGLLGVGP